MAFAAVLNLQPTRPRQVRLGGRCTVWLGAPSCQPLRHQAPKHQALKHQALQHQASLHGRVARGQS